MGKRRTARELALKFLYQTEFNSNSPDSELNSFCDRANVSEEVQNFTQALIKNILFHKKEVDELLEKISANWAPDRMAVIDKNILRLGICELLFDPTTPPKVVINEAVEIAKKFGTEESPDFINGILDKVFKDSKVAP
ncbi:transcription antitermination factor NusB [Nitrospinaceae bacterium]|jgi:N utilization substance protein B|nr:transcription antitermination factor NusB [Nitrospinaceae bacterium]|tara:strand:+ start:1651 stop:2064 length:414 start_codon:yes stop_codon:yes gene_type:complete